MAYPPVKILHVINIPTDSTPPAEGLETITAPVETTTSVPTTENIGTASTPAPAEPTVTATTSVSPPAQPQPAPPRPVRQSTRNRKPV